VVKWPIEFGRIAVTAGDHASRASIHPSAALRTTLASATESSRQSRRRQTAQLSEKPMYKRIVLAYDGSEAGQQALLECSEIARWRQSELHLVAVMPPPALSLAVDGVMLAPPDPADIEREYTRTLSAGITRLASLGYSAHGEVLVGEPVIEIANHARKVAADLIVVGHKQRKGWAARWWHGFTSGSLIEHAPCSVLVVITV
jgi:nucleotide-binding universal stress UspA family protein